MKKAILTEIYCRKCKKPTVHVVLDTSLTTKHHWKKVKCKKCHMITKTLLDLNQKKRISLDEVYDKFNSICLSLPKAISRNATRAIKIEELIRQDPDPTFWDQIFDDIEASPFLTGKSGKSTWIATLDWIINPDNFTKIKEGNYNETNRRRNTRSVRKSGKINI